MSNLPRRTIYSLLALIIIFVLGYIFSNEYYVGSLNAGTLSIGDTSIVVEKALTHSAREQGLGGRFSLDQNAGMLFVFETDGYYGFWMKDMKFPLDIIWMDDLYRVVDVKENVLPDSYPESFLPKTKARYVLEVNSGFAKKHGVSIGSVASFVDHAGE